MGNDPSSGHVRLTALDRLEDIQVVQHVLHAAVIGQSIEKRSDRLLCLHQSSSFNQTLLPSTFYRKRPPRSGPSPETILLHAIPGSARSVWPWPARH
jgi:hypothetical protein